MKTMVTTSEPARVAGAELTRLLRARAEQPTLLMLSGGSALTLLPHIADDVFGDYLTISVLDERYSTDPTVNNFAQLSLTDFYAKAAAAGATFFDSRPLSGEPAAALADRFETFLRTWYKVHPSGATIATLGMGADGHTAGIFPGTIALLDAGSRFVESYEIPVGAHYNRERITVTPAFIKKHLDEAVAFVIGPEKCSLLRLLDTEANPEQYPVALWYGSPAVTLVSDCGT